MTGRWANQRADDSMRNGRLRDLSRVSILVLQETGDSGSGSTVWCDCYGLYLLLYLLRLLALCFLNWLFFSYHRIRDSILLSDCNVAIVICPC